MSFGISFSGLVTTGTGVAVGELLGGRQQTIRVGVEPVEEPSPLSPPITEEPTVEPIPPSEDPPIEAPVFVRTVDVVGPSNMTMSPPGHSVDASAGEVAVVELSCLYPSGHEGATIGVCAGVVSDWVFWSAIAPTPTKTTRASMPPRARIFFGLRVPKKEPLGRAPLSEIGV